MLEKLVNLAMLGLLPLAWQAPLAKTDGGWLFSDEEITVFSGVAQLYETEPVLAILIGVFAVATPYLKTLLLVYAQFSDRAAARALMPLIELLARFSMTDVFLVAFYIVAYSGVGELTVGWGLYFFTGLVIASILAGWRTQAKLRRETAKPRG